MFHQQPYPSHPITSGGINDKKHLGGRFFILLLRHPLPELAEAAQAALREIWTAQEVAKFTEQIGRVVLLPDHPDPEEAGKHRIIMGAYAEALAKHPQHPLCLNLSVIIRAWVRSYERAALAAATQAAREAAAAAAAEQALEPVEPPAAEPETQDVPVPEPPAQPAQLEEEPPAHIVDTESAGPRKVVRIRRKGQ